MTWRAISVSPAPTAWCTSWARAIAVFVGGAWRAMVSGGTMRVAFLAARSGPARAALVGRCRSTVTNHVLTAPRVQALETRI